MRSSLPVLALTFLGVVIAVLGLFAAGDIRVTIVGLVALAVGSLLGTLEQRIHIGEKRRPDRSGD